MSECKNSPSLADADYTHIPSIYVPVSVTYSTGTLFQKFKVLNEIEILYWNKETKTLKKDVVYNGYLHCVIVYHILIHKLRLKSVCMKQLISIIVC